MKEKIKTKPKQEQKDLKSSRVPYESLIKSGRAVDMTGKPGAPKAFQIIGAGPIPSKHVEREEFEIFCDNCEKIVAVITLYSEGESKDDPRPTLKISSGNWICHTTTYSFNGADLTKESLLHIAKLLRQRRFKELARMDNDDIFGFFCRKCGKNYCFDCWRDIKPIFDGDFYDYTLATCPAGHQQEIND